MNILNTFLFFTLLLILNKNCRLKIEKIFSHKIFIKINNFFSLFIILNIFFLILFSTFYLFSNFYLDHVEPQIATVSWFFEYKKIIYNDTSDYERYALIFGPITYYSNYLMMKLFGPSILSSKIISYIFLNLTLLLTFINSYKTTKKINFSLFLTGIMAMIFLSTVEATLRISNDSLAYFLISLSILLCISKYSSFNLIFLSFIIVLLINIKPNLSIAALPSIFYFFFNSKKILKDSIIFSLIVVSVSIVIWSSNYFSIQNYIIWADLISLFEFRDGFNFERLLKNISFCLIWIIPLLFLHLFDWKKISISERIFFLLMLFSSLILSISGSRPGAGTAGLFSIVPSALYLLSKSYQRKTFFLNKEINSFNYLFIYLLLLVFLHSSTKGLLKKINFLNQNNYSNHIIEIKKILSDHPNKRINMAYGSSYNSYLISYLRPILTWDRNNFILDVPHLVSTVSNLQLNPIFLEECSNDAYIVLIDDQPFKSKYWNITLFDKEFLDRFYNNFYKKKNFEFFELWECNK